MTDHVALTGVPAAEAVRQLADHIASTLGAGTTDAGDGLLEAPTFVTTTSGVFGAHEAVTTMTGPDATIWVDDDLAPIQALHALLGQLIGNVVTKGALL